MSGVTEPAPTQVNRDWVFKGLEVAKWCCSTDSFGDTFLPVRGDQASRFPRARGKGR